MVATKRIKGVNVNIEHPFGNRAGIIASGVFSSLSEADQKEAVDELCETLGYKNTRSKPDPDAIKTEETTEKPQ